MNGLRTAKTVSGTTTNYFYNNTVLMGLTSGSNKLLFSYDAKGLVQAVNFNGTYYYYLRNGQGDIVKIIDSGGTAKVEYTYDSWGKKLSCTGTLATTLGKLNPFRYRGYVYDEETQWYYLKSRYYDPETCRFISADVLLSTGQGVIGHNCYAYCLNNPANRSDVDGIWSLPNWVKKTIAAIAVVAVVTAVAAITVATAGAGTAAAVIAVGAAKGAAIGMVSGAAMGASASAIKSRVQTGSWDGAGEAALNGMGDGALSGAITGAITGAASSGLKVARAARAWDNGTFNSGYDSMNYHYNKHVLQEGYSQGNNVVNYTKEALRFAHRNSSALRYTYNHAYGNASWNSVYSAGQGGMFTSAGKIITFWYK
jgi:RHS repeat-associated protein